MGKEFLKKIFSIEDYRETHRRLWFLGISLKYPKAEYRKRKRKSIFYSYRRKKLKITELPPATGQLRDLQLANLSLMKVFDRVCRENNIEYWLFAGSALGAVRHKGFIPWDDDIDVAMPREYFDRFIELFNEKTPNPDLYAKMYNDHKKQSFIIKICHKKSDYLFLDVFAVDFTGKTLTKGVQLELTKKIIDERNSVISKNKSMKLTDLEEIRQNLVRVKEKFVDETSPERPSDILIGVEWRHSEKNWFIKYDSVYPLKEVEFDGCKFYSMANADDYLHDYYGDYMAYPKQITMGHSMCIDLSKKDLEVINKLKKD